AQEDTVNSVERPSLAFYSTGARAAPASVRIAQYLLVLLAARRSPLPDAGVRGMTFAFQSRVDLRGGRCRSEAVRWPRWAVAGGPNPDSGIARHLYGGLLASIGSDEEAVKQLREAARIGPNAADTHNDLAQELALTGRHDEALAEFGEAMRLRDGWAPPMSGA